MTTSGAGGEAFETAMAKRATEQSAVDEVATQVQDTWDSTVAANTDTTPTGAGLPEAAAATQETALRAQAAEALTAAHADILATRNNKPVWHGLEATADVTFPLLLASLSGSMSAGATFLGFIRFEEAKKIGYIATIMTSGGTPTTFFINAYTMDAAGNVANVYTTPDLHTQIPNTGTSAWVIDVLSGPNQIDVEAGDVLAFEAVFTGGGSLKMPVYNTLFNAITPHSSAIPKTFAGFRNSTGSLSPSSIAAGSISYSNTPTIPFFAVGVTAVAANYQPPVPTPFLTSGSHTYPIPAWMIAGDCLDVVLLGGGGGGASSNFGNAPGGDAGSWQTKTLVCGTDFPVGATTISVTVGAGGTHPGALQLAGNAGGNSSVTWTDPAAAPHTTTATGGAGGPAGSFSAATTGEGAGRQTFQGKTYFGGGSTSAANGLAPGGGGAGAQAYQLGYNGAPGAVWVTTRQVAI